jgi:hypothetical protein
VAGDNRFGRNILMNVFPVGAVVPNSAE